MTLTDLKAVALLMQEMGLTHVKIDGLEVMRPEKVVAPGPATDGKVEDKIEEFTSLLKLGDAEIMDRMFPEPIEPGGSDDPASPH